MTPGIKVSASGVPKTTFLSPGLIEFSDRSKLILQEKQAGNDSDLINDELVAMVDKSIEYECISTKQQKQTLSKSNQLHKNKY